MYGTKKCIFLIYETENQKNGRATGPRTLLTCFLSKNKSKKSENKKLVRKISSQGFQHFRTFSKKNIDFLTSRIEFSSQVPILEVVQNTILYIFHIYHFFIGPKLKKVIFGHFGQGTD